MNNSQETIAPKTRHYIASLDETSATTAESKFGVEPARMVTARDLKLLLAPMIVWIAARFGSVIDTTAHELDLSENSDYRQHLEFRLNTLGRTSNDLLRTEPLYVLIRANHGTGKALVEPMKFTIQQSFGGLNMSYRYPGAFARLLVSVPQQTRLSDCEFQAESLQKYLMRRNWENRQPWGYDSYLG